MNTSENDDKPEVTILDRTKQGSCEDNQLKGRVSKSNEGVRTSLENIAEEVLMETKLRKKKVSFKEETEDLGTGQESGEYLKNKEEGEAKILSRESEELDESSMRSEDEQDNLCMLLA